MLAPALAHIFELPTKMRLPRDEYFIVQHLYPAWDRLSLLLIAQVVSLLAAAYLSRLERRVLIPTILAILFIVSAQALFWAYTHPANVATANWTLQSDDWIKLRRQWEFSQAAGACLQLLAVACLIVAVVSRLPIRKRSYYYY